MKKNDVFVHRKWLSDAKHPMRCIVTAIRCGWVYWRADGDAKARDCFPLALSRGYVLRMIGKDKKEAKQP
jgi:hypothetical protein